MYMRVALTIHRDNLPMVLETYDSLSRRLFTFATPTLANAGTMHPHYASCFLYVPDASSATRLLEGIHDLDRFWLADGGIGLSLGGVPCRRCAARIPLWRFWTDCVTGSGRTHSRVCYR